MPVLVDLVWRPSASEETLPTTGYPVKAPAVYRNDNYSLTFRLFSDDANTVPYVPEGTFTAQVRAARLRASETPGDPIVSFSCSVGGDDDNELTVSLTRAQAALIPDSAYWDCQEALDAGVNARTWFTGKVKGWGDITR